MKFSEIINDQQLATEAIRRWITTAVCIVIAIVAATWIVNQQFFMFVILAGVVVTTFVTVGMHRRAWILIVLCWGFRGLMNAFFVPMATRDLVVLMVVCSYIAQRALGQTVPRQRGVLHALVIINCAYVAFTFVCHPVGAHALGSETMGIRPYFSIFTASCAYWILVHMPESYTSVTRIPLWLTLSITFSTAIAVITYLFPSTTPYVWFFYSDVDITKYLGSLKVVGEQSFQRFGQLGPFGVALTQFLAARFPSRRLANPLRWQFYLCLLGLGAIMASGFRNELLVAVAYLALAALFRGVWRDVVIGGLIGTLLLGFLVFGQGRFFDLPLQMQRALGSLPGQWDEVVKESVKTSNARWLWWRQLLEEGAVVNNWWIGDGSGVSEKDYSLIASGRVGFEETAEITGGFHNGPLTTIRFAGLVGLVLLYGLMITAAVYSVKCVHRCRGTPLLPVSIFLAIQLVWAPFHYTFIFGSYNEQVPEQFFWAGLLLLIWRMSERPPPSTAPARTAESPSLIDRKRLLST